MQGHRMSFVVKTRQSKANAHPCTVSLSARGPKCLCIRQYDPPEPSFLPLNGRAARFIPFHMAVTPRTDRRRPYRAPLSPLISLSFCTIARSDENLDTQVLVNYRIAHFNQTITVQCRKVSYRKSSRKVCAGYLVQKTRTKMERTTVSLARPRISIHIDRMLTG